MDIYALAVGMGTEGTFVEAPALPRGLTGVLASVVDPEGPREIFWYPVPLCQTGYMTSIRNPGASWPLCCGLKRLGIRIWTERHVKRQTEYTPPIHLRILTLGFQRLLSCGLRTPQPQPLREGPCMTADFIFKKCARYMGGGRVGELYPKHMLFPLF